MAYKDDYPATLDACPINILEGVFCCIIAYWMGMRRTRSQYKV